MDQLGNRAPLVFLSDSPRSARNRICNCFKMLRKKEKKALASILMLLIGWPIGLDQFFEGKNEKGISTIIGWTMTALLFFMFWV